MNRTTPVGAKTWLVLAILPTTAFAQTAAIVSDGSAIQPASSGPAMASSTGASSTGEPLRSAANTGNPVAAPATQSEGPLERASARVSPPSDITWHSPPDCPAPRERLDALLRVPSKHPLWGSVEVARQPTGWSAHLRLNDGPEGAPNGSVSDRTLVGDTCTEVTDAVLLVVSIMQREQQELDATPVTSSSTEPAPAVEVPAPAQPPAAPAVTPPARAARSPQPTTDQAAPTATAVAVGAAWSLWNGKTPALGAVAEFEKTWGHFGIRAQLGWATSVNPIPTSESVKVGFTTYDAGLRLCFDMLAGVNVCGGPTLQRITVLGDDIGVPTESSAWFPGASVALHGSQNRAGLGLWGAIGANFRFKEIALDVNPLGEVATITRATLYAWVGPQWRWR